MGEMIKRPLKPIPHKSITHRLRLGVLSCAALSLAGCGGQNGKDAAQAGQVLARVNGAFVTRSELELELGLLPAHQREGQPIRQALLARLIDRKLLLAEAEARGLERSAQFVAMNRRNREALLAQMAQDVALARLGGVSVAAAQAAQAQMARDQAGATAPLAAIRAQLAAQQREAAARTHLAALRAGAQIVLASPAPAQARPQK